MELVSTSNLVSSETEKTTTACNFQLDYAMRGQYEYESNNIQIWSYSQFHDSRNVKKHPKKHIYTKQQKNPTSNKLKFALFWKCIIHHSKKRLTNKVFPIKQQTSEKGGKGVTFFRAYSFYIKNKLKSATFNGKKIII